MKIVVAAIAFAVAACVGSHPVDVPDPQMTLGVDNGTSIVVGILVNGVRIDDVSSSTNKLIPAAELPPLPWHVQAISPSGRPLLVLDVNSGDVHRFPNGVFSDGISGVGKRADLSCGRLDVYSGPPMLGPMPGPGVPADCD